LSSDTHITIKNQFTMYKQIATVLASSLMALALQAQVCDPSLAPSGLTSSYTPGTGALLQWNAIPGSEGVQIQVDLPSGGTISRRIVGFEVDQFLAVDAVLTPGVYTWRVQAACSTVPPFNTTPISESNTFVVDGPSSCPATVADVDGNIYNTVEIGGQCWMAENLKTERYNNGDAIPTGLSNSAWGSTTSGAFAVYQNVAANKAIYGLLYNWFAVNDSRALCPTGWHVPTDGEFTQLTDFLGGLGVAGGKIKTTGTLSAGTGLWLAPNTGATNSSGFSALPAGERDEDGTFEDLSREANFWSSTERTLNSGWYRDAEFDDNDVDRGGEVKRYGLSVRCLKD
jgi:uncharacterized protein (TIGR02145 family)